MSYIAQALRAVRANARKHSDDEYRPEFHMLAEEMLELSLALRDRHEQPAWLELIQIGGIVVNWLADIASVRGDAEIVAYTRQHEEIFCEER